MENTKNIASSFTDVQQRITEYIFVENTPKPSDIIFIPGNGYPQMAQQGAALFQKGYAPYLLPSGRYSATDGCFQGVKDYKEIYNGNYNTEWEFLKDVLVKNQVPESAVLREDTATYTYENAIFSRKVTEEAGLEIKEAILCCRNVHARRCLMYYQMLYPKTRFYVVPSIIDGITSDNWTKSEAGIAAVTGEMERIIRQSILLEKSDI